MDCWSEEVVSVDRRMPGPKYRHPSPTIILNGIPYWELSDGVILEFDPGYNFLNYFVVPDVGLSYSLLNWKDFLTLVPDVGLSYSLLNWKDFLTLIGYNLDGIMHVFIYFKRYGHGLKLCKIEYDVWKNEFAPFPMCFKYGGEIVFNGMSNLYDPVSKKIKNIGYHYDHVHGFSYTPSLVSLEGMERLQPKIAENRLPLTRQCGRIRSSRRVHTGCCPMIRKVTRGGRTGKIYPKGWKCISRSGRNSTVRHLPTPGTRPARISLRRTGRLRGQIATTASNADYVEKKNC